MKARHGDRFIYETRAEMPRPPSVLVIPAPMEETVTYGRGAAQAPAAILAASMQVEYYDRGLGLEPCLEFGIDTARPLRARGAAAWIRAVRGAWRAASRAGMLPVVLGGEHTVTIGAVQAALEADGRLVVVQVDAHADLRSSYLGGPLSHACVMRRLREAGAEIASIGVRAFSAEEAVYMQGDRGVTAIAPEAVRGRKSWRRRLSSLLRGRPMYLTIDLDGLDPSVIPAVGTPVPGGLSWSEALEAVETACSSCARVAGMDVVELAPCGGDSVSAFASAQLLYHAISRAAAANGLLRR